MKFRPLCKASNRISGSVQRQWLAQGMALVLIALSLHSCAPLELGANLPPPDESPAYQELVRKYPRSKYMRAIYSVPRDNLAAQKKAHIEARNELASQIQTSISDTLDMLTVERSDGLTREVIDIVKRHTVAISNVELFGLIPDHKMDQYYYHALAALPYDGSIEILTQKSAERSETIRKNIDDEHSGSKYYLDRHDTITAIWHLILAFSAALDREAYRIDSGVIKGKRDAARTTGMTLSGQEKVESAFDELDHVTTDVTADLQGKPEKDAYSLRDVWLMLTGVLEKIALEKDTQSENQPAIAGLSLDPLKVRITYKAPDGQRHPLEGALVRYVVEQGDAKAQEELARTNQDGWAGGEVTIGQNLQEDIIVEGWIDYRKMFKMEEQEVMDIFGEIYETRRSVQFILKVDALLDIEPAIGHLAREFVKKYGGQRNDFVIDKITFNDPALKETGGFPDEFRDLLSEAINFKVGSHRLTEELTPAGVGANGYKLDASYRYGRRDKHRLFIQLSVKQFPNLEDEIFWPFVPAKSLNAIEKYGHRPTPKFTISPPIGDQEVILGKPFEDIHLDGHLENITRPALVTWEISGGDYIIPEIDGRVARFHTDASNWTGQETLIFSASADPAGAFPVRQQVSFSVSEPPDEPPPPPTPIPRRPYIFEIPAPPITNWPDYRIDLDAIVRDQDTPKRELRWVAARSSDVRVEIANPGGNWTAIVRPINPNWYGTANIRFTVTDPTGLYHNRNLTVERVPTEPPRELFQPALRLAESLPGFPRETVPRTDRMENRSRDERRALDILLRTNPRSIPAYQQGWREWDKFAEQDFTDSPAADFTKAVADWIATHNP